MGLKLTIQQNTIPIEFENPETGEVALTLYFDKSDESIEKMYKQDEVIKQLNNELEDKQNEGDMEDTKKIVRECFDSVLGEGSFEKVYDLNPSCLIILQYYLAAVVHIRQELDDFEGAKSLQKYING